MACALCLLSLSCPCFVGFPPSFPPSRFLVHVAWPAGIDACGLFCPRYTALSNITCPPTGSVVPGPPLALQVASFVPAPPAPVVVKPKAPAAPKPVVVPKLQPVVAKKPMVAAKPPVKPPVKPPAKPAVVVQKKGKRR